MFETVINRGALEPPKIREFAVDDAHTALLFGLLVSAKPLDIFEMGVGTGHTSNVILDAIAYNGRGKLTCVDNWFDWWHSNPGQEPPVAQKIRDRGATIVVQTEEEWTRSAPTDSADFILSDCDHVGAHKYLDETMRVLRPGGLILFHDICNVTYPGLCEFPKRLAHLNPIVFSTSTRADESCYRGIMLAMNAKPTPPRQA